MAAGESDALADAINAMAEVSKIQTDTMQELKKAVDTLLTAVDALPKAEKDDLNENDRKDIEEETMWEMVRDTAKEQEKETVESWKDELNNLLVFAGLFSAVVTAFTVESYTWLQQDPGDASNALLAQLSLQLSMFMIAFAGSPPSSAFANSTTPALSLSDVQSSFSPVSYAVSVNTLWVLSLTLSLISAFFAITAQQWMRQLHLPPEMPVRKAVQLLEARKDGLTTWQVPSIIALLPLLLQIAVIIFLVGLFLLLRSLNATVATAFGSVALVGLLAFLATVFIPLITARCPFKTPLVPTVAVVLQCLSYPLAVLSVPFVASLDRFMQSPTWDWAWWKDYISYSTDFGRHMFVDMGQFWLTREYQYICPRDGADSANLVLERSSLIQTFLSAPARRSWKVSQLLNSSKGNGSLQGFRHTIVSSLRVFRTGLEWSELIPVYQLDPKMAPYIGRWLSARHHHLLWRYLQQRDWKRDGEVAFAESQCLILFHELDNAFPAMRLRYGKHLLQICAQQELSLIRWLEKTVLACLVLDLIMNRGYVLDEGDADALLAFASKVYSKYRNLEDDNKRQLFLVSTALALITVNKSGAARSAGITSVVNILAGALDKESTKENAVFELQRYYRDGSNWSQVYLEFMLPARIMETLCKALSDYAASPLLSPSPAHLLHLSHISASLRHICTGSYGRYVHTDIFRRTVYGSYAEKPEMQAACRNLDELNAKIGEIDELVYKRKGIITLKAILSAKARLAKPALPGNGGNDARPDAVGALNEPSDTVEVTAETNNLESAAGEPAENAVEHNHHPLIATITDRRQSLRPPSVEHSTDPDPATFEDKSTISSALDKSEGETHGLSPQGVEDTSAGDADGDGTHCMTGAPILPAQVDDPGSASSAARDDERGMSRQEPLRSNTASTDGDLSQLPPVESGTDRHLAASGSDSTASSAPETGKVRESPAVSSHLPASKLQESRAIQVVAPFRSGSAAGNAALSGPRDTGKTCLGSDADSLAIDDNHFRDEGDGDEETCGSGGGGVERNRTTSGESYAHRQDARSTATLITTAASSGRADEPETARVVILEDNHAGLRLNRPTSSSIGSSEGVDGSSSRNIAAAIPGRPGDTEATQSVSIGETNVAAGESLFHDENDSATVTNVG